MHSIEEVEAITGYSKNTLYSLTSILNIKPYKNHIKGTPSKGVYDKSDIDKLLEYKSLTTEHRKSKKEALRIISEKTQTNSYRDSEAVN